MSTHTLRRPSEDKSERIERIFRTRNEEEFCQQICKQIVEMVMRGEKVYLTPHASEILRPTLEKYGITLVPAPIEYPCILIDVDTPEEGRITIKYLHRREEEIERKVKIEEFLRILEETLKRKRPPKQEIYLIITQPETRHDTLAT
ncbi:MAG: hypothetical protein QXU65_05120 [Sulfolobales archaeon]